MTIDYQKFLDESMLEVVKKVLLHVRNEGLQGDHTLYISFNTQDPLVQKSARMKQRYQQEITIVLQYQFDNLIVEPHGFSVGLSFDGIYEYIKVPFRAITAFVDPSVKFSLQFRHIDNIDLSDKANTTLQENVDNIEELSDNVIVLDKFRKKNKP